MSGLTISDKLTKREPVPRKPREPGAIWRVLRWVALTVTLVCWGVAAWLLFVQWRGFSQQTVVMPTGLAIGGVPVEHLPRDEAEARLRAVYLDQPITLDYAGEPITMPAQAAGVTLDMDAMFAEVQAVAAPDDPLAGFWGYLWGTRVEQRENIPLIASYSPEAIDAFLADVAARYDAPSLAPWADPNAMVTVVGSPGAGLDIAASRPAIEAVVLNPDPAARRATLVVSEQPADQPTLAMLEQQITDYLQANDVDGLFSMYLVDLRSDETLYMNLRNGNEPVPPDIAYSGMSIMKIIIMTEFYRQVGDDGALPYELDLVSLSITESSNWTSNLLINWIGDLSDSTGLYRINETLATLGMQSSFLGGLYDTEDAPGFRFTPANTREDVVTGADPYMQTTPGDMGRLMTAIYRCAERNDGLLIETLPGQWTQQECQAMIGWLSENKIGVLIEAGVPEGTTVAHKHAWGDGNTIGDSAIVFTPGGDYVLVYYIWRPEYAYWEPNSAIMADISKAVYHYFNPITLEN